VASCCERGTEYSGSHILFIISCVADQLLASQAGHNSFESLKIKALFLSYVPYFEKVKGGL
jgi:hypothetical protein